MKKFFTILSVAAVMTACNTNPGTLPVTAAPAVQPATADTAGLAKYNEWKTQQEEEAVNESKPAVRYAVSAAPVRKARKVYHAPVSRPAAPDYTPSTASNPNTSSTTGSTYPESTPAGNDDVAMSNESANTAEAEKKGWSKKAKGAVIGGAAGAAAGAIINKKNRAVGAVIGGVIGAGGGYVIGSKMDKKDGR
jgi:hypothetical protein